MNTPRRSSRFADVQKFMGPESDWTLISRRIKEGTVIPIIGNSFFSDRIFGQFFADDNQSSHDDGQLPLTVDELLSSEWANTIQYPMADYTSLARVALYNRVLRHHDAEEANRSYLRFIKGVLLAGSPKFRSTPGGCCGGAGRPNRGKKLRRPGAGAGLPAVS